MERQRIVIKIGSSSLTNAKGEIDQIKFQDHIDAIVKLKQDNHDVILVSSGAVAAGFKKLGYPSRPVTIKGKQAAAAVGQSLLIQAYNEAFNSYDIVSAQVLLTRTDFSEKKRYQNAYSTFSELLERSVIPIINENDTVSVSELTFGDNDMLSALVSGLLHANQLIILTDVNGLYDANPAKNPEAKRLDQVTSITEEMLGFASGAGSKVGTGGMQSKLVAAKYAMHAGVTVFVGKGQGAQKLVDIANGHGDGTYFIAPQKQILPNTKQWMNLSDVKGKIFIDEGAVKALMENGKSLLPAGVYAYKGRFQKGDVVEVFNRHILLGRGEVQYSSDELEYAMGKKTSELKVPSLAVIHRNQWLEL